MSLTSTFFGWMTRCGVLFALSSSSAAWAAPGDFARIDLTGPAVPYAQVSYSVAAKRGTVVLSVVKRFEAGFGRQDEVGLATAAELDALFVDLERLGVFELTSRDAEQPPRATALWVTLTVQRGDRTRRIRMLDPATIADPRYSAVVRRITQAVTSQVDAILFRDSMLLPSEAGHLRLRSTPVARVVVDGVILDGTTPVSGLMLPAGPHEIRLEPLAEGVSRTYKVKIEVGQTTSLNVELK